MSSLILLICHRIQVQPSPAWLSAAENPNATVDSSQTLSGPHEAEEAEVDRSELCVCGRGGGGGGYTV